MKKIRNVEVGDKLVVKAVPISIYHPMNGDEVKVISVFFHFEGEKNCAYYAFSHPRLGHGVMRGDGGFDIPLKEKENYKLHSDPEMFDREEIISQLVGKIKAQEYIAKCTTPYKNNAADIKSLEKVLIDYFGFTREALDALC